MYTVAALYQFVLLENYQNLKEPLLKKMQAFSIHGTILLAREGINGTISGSQKNLDALLGYLRSIDGLEHLDVKYSYTQEPPFKRTKVKLKKEIVTLGVKDISPVDDAGTYVEPEDWNSLISAPDVTVVDTRNNYEVEIGSFKHAKNPHTETFREFPDYVKKNLSPEKNKKVAMFCTGGIRCEKSTALLKKQGFEEVYHLKGGILKYLEKIPQEESLWEGECFVFDDRVAVDHQLQKGQFEQCYACRYPITQADIEDASYLKGVSCPRCVNKSSSDQKTRFKERQKQVELAKNRGENHIG